MRFIGLVKFFDASKGWGFITRGPKTSDVFVHARDLKRGGIEYVSPGDRLSFEVARDEHGDRAVSIVASH